MRSKDLGAVENALRDGLPLLLVLTADRRLTPEVDGDESDVDSLAAAPSSEGMEAAGMDPTDLALAKTGSDSRTCVSSPTSI